MYFRYIIILYVLVEIYFMFFLFKIREKIIKGIMYNICIFNIEMELLDIYLIVSC